MNRSEGVGEEWYEMAGNRLGGATPCRVLKTRVKCLDFILRAMESKKYPT